MKNTETYIKEFESEEKAYFHMVSKNRANRVNGQIYCLVDGPSNNFAVVDLNTAINLNVCYSWSF